MGQVYTLLNTIYKGIFLCIPVMNYQFAHPLPIYIHDPRMLWSRKIVPDCMHVEMFLTKTNRFCPCWNALDTAV